LRELIQKLREDQIFKGATPEDLKARDQEKRTQMEIPFDGKRIVGIRTLGTMYDHNCVALTRDDGAEFKMNVDQFLQLIRGKTLYGKVARKHAYLYFTPV
jgi:hypothetical protein